MDTRRNHSPIGPHDNTGAKRSITARQRGLLIATACVLLLGCLSCGVHPKAAASSDVSPIQLASRPQQARTEEAAAATPQRPPVEPTATIPALQARSTTPEPVRQTRSQAIAKSTPQQWSPEPALPKSTQVALGQNTPEAAVGLDAPTADLSPLGTGRAVNMPGLMEPGMADQEVSVNFEEVDIRTVLKTIGEITGINFIPHQSVSGTVTVMSPTPIRLGDIYGFLQSILDVHGYAAIETDNAVKIVPKTDAAKHSLVVRIGADPTTIPRNDALVTQIIPIKYADAAEVSQIITPVLSKGAQMATYPRTNSIMISDTSANIHHIAQIIRQLDVEGSKEKVLLFPLMHASAPVLSEQITRILEKTQATPQAGRGRTAQSASQGPRVMPDERTNSIIVVAGEQEADTIAKLVEQLDIQRPVGMDNVHVTYLKNADANEVALSLETALTGMKLTGAVDATQQIQVTADGSTNSLIIAASPQDFEVINQIIEKLDIVREQVLVEMMILEVTEEALTEIGVDWATLDEAVANSTRGFGLTNLGPRLDFLSGDLEGLAVGAWREMGSGVQIGAILHALQKESGVNVLSTPHILTSNHRKASIIVGENRAFVMQSRITETSDFITPTVIKSYEYKDVGITLEITPHISQGGLVRLEVDSEFTKLIEDVTSGTSDTPTTAKRNAQTVVTMKSGATVVIGGLIRDDTTHVERKVPIVGSLPLVGNLFKSQKDLVQKTNLLIFITPHVMTTQEELLEMTRTKQEQMPPEAQGSR